MYDNLEENFNKKTIWWSALCVLVNEQGWLYFFWGGGFVMKL